MRFTILAKSERVIYNDVLYEIIDYTDLTKEFIRGKQIYEYWHKLNKNNKANQINVKEDEDSGYLIIDWASIKCDTRLFALMEKCDINGYKMIIKSNRGDTGNKFIYFSIIGDIITINGITVKLRSFNLVLDSLLAYYYKNEKKELCIGFYLSISNPICIELRLRNKDFDIYTSSGTVLRKSVKYEGLSKVLVQRGNTVW